MGNVATVEAWTLKHFLIWLLTIAAVLGDGTQSVVNEKQHYRVTFPNGWNIWKTGSEMQTSATTYPQSRAAQGGVTPPGQAEITIFPHTGTPESLDQWVTESLRDVEEIRRSRVTLTADHGGVRAYTEVDQRYDVAPGVYCHRVTDFFILRGHLFAAQLEFRESDPRESAYRAALKQVVQSMASTERGRGK